MVSLEGRASLRLLITKHGSVGHRPNADALLCTYCECRVRRSRQSSKLVVCREVGGRRCEACSRGKATWREQTASEAAHTYDLPTFFVRSKECNVQGIHRFVPIQSYS